MRRHQPRFLRSLSAAGAATVLLLAGCAGVLPGSDGVADGTTGVDATADPTPGEPTDTTTGQAEPDEPSPSDAASLDPTPQVVPETTPEAAPDARRTVAVVPVGSVKSSTVVSAGGYVADAIELGGTCTFTVTQGADTVSGTSAADPDATVTWCENVDLTLPHPGAPWTLELRYTSDLSVGDATVTSDGEIS